MLYITDMLAMNVFAPEGGRFLVEPIQPMEVIQAAFGGATLVGSNGGPGAIIESFLTKHGVHVGDGPFGIMEVGSQFVLAEASLSPGSKIITSPWQGARVRLWFYKVTVEERDVVEEGRQDAVHDDQGH